MEVSRVTGVWQFHPPLEDDRDEVVCSSCKEATALSEWLEGSVYCEDCGEHTAMVCPKCREPFDHVYAAPFAVRLFQEKSP